MRIWKSVILVAASFVIASVLARADYVIPVPNSGTLATVFAFVCQGTKQCPSHVLIDSAGNEKATSGNPVRVDPTGTTTQPVTATANNPVRIDPIGTTPQPVTQGTTPWSVSQGALPWSVFGSLGNNTDNVAPVTTGNVGVDSYSYVFDGTNWQRSEPINAGTAGVPGTDVITQQPPLGTPVTMQNAAVANGNGTVLPITTYPIAIVNAVCSVACSGGTTINFEGTDSTGTFFAIYGIPLAGGAGVTTATAGGQWIFNTAGLVSIRARISAYSGGTITITGNQAFGNPAGGANPNGPATPANSAPVVVAGKTSEVCVSPAVTASAYAAGNVVGGKLTLANAFGAVGSGVLQSIRITFKDVQTAEFDAYEFASNPTGSTWTDKTAPAIVAADVLLAKPPIKLTNNASGLGTHTVYGADAIGRSVATGATSDYFVLITTGTPTFASTSDVQFCASYLQD